MKCASCARDTPAGARYCVHCGAEQSVPTPIAAVAAAAAAMVRPPRQLPQAANAAQADPAAEERVPPAARNGRDPRPGPVDRPQGARRDEAGRMAATAGAESLADAGVAPRAAASTPGDAIARDSARPAVPAYASAPRRTGTALLLVASCFAVALVAFAGWRMFAGEAQPGEDASHADDESVMSAFPPEATPQRPRRATVAAQAPPAQPAQEAAAPGRETSSAAGIAASSGSAPGVAAAHAPVEIKPLPAKPAHKPVKRPATAKAPPQPSPPPKASSPATTTPEPPPPVARAPAVAAAPAAAPIVDRWTRMNDELSRCTREDFIARVICGQRVRFKYCDGYWGKLAQCPGNPVPDRGQ